MTYSQFFASRGIPMPANYASVSNLEIAPDQMPVMEATFPAAPVPPTPGVPPAPVVTPAAVAPAAVPTTPSTSFDTVNNWPTVFILLEDLEKQGGEYYDMMAPVESRQHPGMMVNRAFVRNVKFAGTTITQVAYTASRRDANNNVIGYLSVAECDTLAISSDPRTPGRYSLKLTKGNLEKLLANAVKMKAKPAFDWAKFQVATNLTQA